MTPTPTATPTPAPADPPAAPRPARALLAICPALRPLYRQASDRDRGEFHADAAAWAHLRDARACVAASELADEACDMADRFGSLAGWPARVLGRGPAGVADAPAAAGFREGIEAVEAIAAAVRSLARGCGEKLHVFTDERIPSRSAVTLLGVAVSQHAGHSWDAPLLAAESKEGGSC